MAGFSDLLQAYAGQRQQPLPTVPGPVPMPVMDGRDAPIAPAVGPDGMPMAAAPFGRGPMRPQPQNGQLPPGLMNMFSRLQGTPVWDRLMGGQFGQKFGGGFPGQAPVAPVAPMPVAPVAPPAPVGNGAMPVLPTQAVMPQQQQGWRAGDVFGGGGQGGQGSSAGLGLRPRNAGFGL